MQYVFLVVAAAWTLQFILSYWQLQRFHRRLADLRRTGRCAVGMEGSRWRGKVYAVLVLGPDERVKHLELFQGATILATLRPNTTIDGMPLGTLLMTETPPTGLTTTQWRAIKHAAQFFTTQAATTHLATT